MRVSIVSFASFAPLAWLVAGGLAAAPASTLPSSTPPSTTPSSTTPSSTTPSSTTPPLASPTASHVADMELRVACPRGHYLVSAGTPSFEYEVSSDGVFVHDEEGENHATLDCSVGCDEVTGFASCIRARAAAEATGDTSADRAPAPILAFASLAVSCPGGKSFHLAITTNEGSGRCVTNVGADDEVTGGTCSDDESNEASIECALNAGQGACASTAGTGSCTGR